MKDAATFGRRDFLALTGAGMGIAAIAGLAGCSPKESVPSKNEINAVDANSTSDWLGSAPEIDESAINETKEADYLIVGAGNSGMSAAATAANLGLDFIICEKSSEVLHARHWIGAVNTKWHKEAGFTIDEGKLLNELTRYASGKCRQDVWKTWINESSDTIDFIDEIMKNAGMEIYLDTEGYDHATGGTDYYAPPIQHMWYDPQDTAQVPPCLRGEATQKHRNLVLEEYINKAGYDISYNHKLIKLEQDGDGKITGGIFETSNGYSRINANKAVILTTGGYAANPIMMQALAPAAVQSCTASYYSPNSMGEGIKAAMWVGAAKDTDSAPMIFDRGAATPDMTTGSIGEDENAAFPASDGEMVLGSEPFLSVNRDGKRFMNESTPYDTKSFQASRQADGVFCSIFDSNAPADALRFKVVGCAKIGTALLQMGPIEDSYKKYIDMGSLMKADTIEELAGKLQLPADELKKTVDRYNEFYDAQEDADYGKEPFRLSAIRQAPFYGFWCGGALLTTLDGLSINKDMQVLDKDCKVIKGLYAAGDCSGNLFSGNYPEYLVGCACGRSITEGRHAILHASGELA